MTSVLEMEKRLLLRLIDEGVLDGKTDIFFPARRLMGATWSSFLLWSKGFISENDFKRTYLREQLYLLIPLTADQKAKEMMESAIDEA